MAKMGVAIFTVVARSTDRGGLHPANSGRFKLYSPATLRVTAELRNYWTAKVENTKEKKNLVVFRLFNFSLSVVHAKFITDYYETQ